MRKSSPVPFSLQQDQYDCGVACLRNILAYYHADISIEKLREWSGAGLQGTSLLGLHQAAGQAGFNAEGARANGIADLLEVKHPCILHVTMEGALQHYVVYYPQADAGDQLLIGDPAKGVQFMSAAELEKIWAGKTVLLLEPGEKLSRWQQQRQKKIRWLWQLLKEDVHYLYVALGIGAVCALLNLSTAIFSQQLLDHILPGKQRSQLYAGLFLLGLLLILKSLFSWFRQTLLIRQAYQFNIRVTGGFFRSILYLNKFFFDNRRTGDMIARLNDTLRIQQAVSYVLGEMAIQCLLLLATLIFLFFYYWPIAVFCLLMIPVLYGIVKYFEKDIMLGQRSVMISHALNESNYVDSIRGIHTIKVMNRQSLFARIGRDIFAGFQRAGLQLGRIRIRFSAILEITTALFLLTVTGWAAIAVWHGSIRMGQMIAILQMAGLLMQTAILVALTNLQIQEAAVALDRMYEFTMVEPEFEPETENQPTAARLPRFEKLTVSHMGFRFPGRKLLLKDLSLEVGRGEIVAISGESGQGKSTLLQVLQKFYPWEGGMVSANDQDLRQIDTVAWRKLIGVVPQDIVVFSGSLVANIALDPNPENAERLVAFCRQYGFDKFFESFPQSYATILGEGGVALSGGQKQLLALARCLYAEPQLILLDEPTASMDAATEEFVLQLLRQVSQHSGLLIISHKDSLTAIADRVYLLDNGISYPVVRETSLPVV